MKANFLQDYQKLAGLLDQEHEALRNNDAQKLSGLRPLIIRYSNRVEARSAELAALGDSEKAVIRPLLKELSRKVATNLKGWEDRKRDLEELREQLRSARRFARGVTQGETRAEQRVSVRL